MESGDKRIVQVGVPEVRAPLVQFVGWDRWEDPPAPDETGGASGLCVNVGVPPGDLDGDGAVRRQQFGVHPVSSVVFDVLAQMSGVKP